MTTVSVTDELARLADALGSVTVEIRGGRGRSLGAGVVWSAPHGVITNAHVVAGRDACKIRFSDGMVEAGRVVRMDERRDLALIDVAVGSRERARLRDPEALRTGDLVCALGHPFGLPRALAVGIVHRTDGRWVQADLRLAPGFSGGPLADAHGHVVGVNAMIARGLGLAIPTSAVARFLGASAPAARLGVVVRPVALDGRRGLLVLEVTPGSVAERSGVLIGDVILKRESPLEIIRGGERVALALERPDSETRAA